MALKKLLKKFDFLVRFKRFVFATWANLCWHFNDKVMQYLPISSKYLGGLKHELSVLEYVKAYIDKRKEKGENIDFWGFYPDKIDIDPPKIVLGTSTKEASVGPRQADTFRYLVKIPNGRIYNEGCAIVTHDDYLLKPLSNAYGSNTKVHPLFSKFFLPRTTFLKGKTLVLKAGWGHFHVLVDALSLLYLIEQIGMKVEDFDHFIFQSLDNNVYEKIYSKYGIPRSATISMNAKNDAYECEELYTASFNWNGTWFRDFILSKLNYDIKLPVGDKIFVSREKAKMRRVVNEDEVMEELEKYGFVKINNEDYTFEEQIALYKNARYIVSTHGANLTNVIFCEPGAKVCEIRYYKHTRYFKAIYYELAVTHQLDYYLMYCNESSKSIHWEGDDEVDLKIDLGDLRKMLHRMGLAEKN
jgi:hypothetical protein